MSGFELLFISGSEILFILLIIFLLFGTKSISELARILGKGYQQFQKASDEIKKEISQTIDNENKTLKKHEKSPDDLKG